MISQINIAKGVQTEKKKIPQFWLEVTFGARFGFDKFVVFAAFTSISKILFIRGGRVALARIVSEKKNDELWLVWAKIKALAIKYR